MRKAAEDSVFKTKQSDAGEDIDQHSVKMSKSSADDAAKPKAKAAAPAPAVKEADGDGESSLGLNSDDS